MRNRRTRIGKIINTYKILVKDLRGREQSEDIDIYEIKGKIVPVLNKLSTTP
jgi:hypothetical protein